MYFNEILAVYTHTLPALDLSCPTVNLFLPTLVCKWLANCHASHQ